MNSRNAWDILIGVVPSNINQNSVDLYNQAWTLICGYPAVSIKNGNPTFVYQNRPKLKENDIVEIIVDNIKGELSFAVNGILYGLACNIPLDIDLSPFVLIHGVGESIELLNN